MFAYIATSLLSASAEQAGVTSLGCPPYSLCLGYCYELFHVLFLVLNSLGLLVAVSWTVAPCFPFSGNPSLFPPAAHNGGCRLDLVKEQLPWFGEFENVSGRTSCCRARTPPSTPLKTSAESLAFPRSHGVRTKGGFFGAETRRRSPLLLCGSSSPTLAGIVWVLYSDISNCESNRKNGVF